MSSTIKLWSKEESEKLLRLAQESIRCALAATTRDDYTARAREAREEYERALIEIMQPPLVIDLLRMILQSARDGGHLKITFPAEGA